MKLNLNDPNIVSEMKAGTRTVSAYKSGNIVARDDATGEMTIIYSTGDKVFFQHDGTEYQVIRRVTHDGITWNKNEKKRKTTTHLDG